MDGQTMLATARFVEPARGRELEVIRDIFTDRLHRHSDAVDATRELES